MTNEKLKDELAKIIADSVIIGIIAAIAVGAAMISYEKEKEGDTKCSSSE